MKKPLLILSLFLILITLTTFNPNNSISKKIFFQIKEVKIEDFEVLDEKNISKFFLNKLEDSNLLFLEKRTVTNIAKKFDLIDAIEVKKIYPHTLKLRIIEKKIIAILVENKKFFYLSDKGQKIRYFSHVKLKSLPYIIGEKNNFIELYSSLTKANFPIKNIKAFYHFDIGRWDIEFIDGRTVKLPPLDFFSSIKNFIEIKNKSNFKKYVIFDYRIKDQLILK